MVDIAELGPGEIGFLTASIKQVRDTRVGDTITHERKGTDDPLPGFKPSVPVVFCGLFPVDSAQFEDLRDAIEMCRDGRIPDMKTEVALLRLADHLGYVHQLDAFADDLPADLRARFRPRGLSPKG